MPTLTIDDRTLTVPDGTTILQAALAHGIEIPHYCYHPGLTIAGNCRICLVEIEKFPKPVIACNTTVTEGMVVHTNSPKTREWQNAVMEFLLINHPLDCPICDQAGECKLQEYSYRYGQSTTRFVEEKVHGPKRRTLGPHVVFDWERCIKCTRCIRFCEDVTGTGELGMFLRGVREEIGVHPSRPLANPYSGNVVDLCPVGALTLREFRFRSRVWFVTDIPTTCPGCARGCTIDAGVFRNEVFRITPRQNHAVNRWWICDEGRLWGERLAKAGERRLTGPRGRSAAGADPWEAALADAATALLAAAKDGKARLLASPRASLEETWLLAKLAKALGGAPVHLPVHERGADDDLLIRADRTPNRRGASAVLEATAGGARPVAELADALAAGKVSVLFALGPGLVGPVDDEAAPLDAATASRAAERIVIDAHTGPLSEAATVLLPATGWGEAVGHYVNFAGRVQRADKCLVPRTDCRPATLTLIDLITRIVPGTELTPDAVREALARDVAALSAIDWAALPASTGQDIAGADAAASAPKATGASLRMIATGVPVVGR